MAVNDAGFLMRIDLTEWLHAFRNITTATNERTLISETVPASGLGHSASAIGYEHGRAVSSALVLANMNSLPLDWATRSSIGGINMNFFILKQLPVLSPEAYLEANSCGHPWVLLIIPRVLELTYTSEDMEGFAKDLGFAGPPFPWDEQRRLCLRSELDAIFAHMYGLDRSELEWILDAPTPSSSFPTLKEHEIKAFGEYRTQRFVLQAFDSLGRGEVPHISVDASP